MTKPMSDDELRSLCVTIVFNGGRTERISYALAQACLRLLSERDAMRDVVEAAKIAVDIDSPERMHTFISRIQRLKNALAALGMEAKGGED